MKALKVAASPSEVKCSPDVHEGQVGNGESASNDRFSDLSLESIIHTRNNIACAVSIQQQSLKIRQTSQKLMEMSKKLTGKDIKATR